jgi:hypothetical protein
MQLSKLIIAALLVSSLVLPASGFLSGDVFAGPFTSSISSADSHLGGSG